jgi:hypothetical protein
VRNPWFAIKNATDLMDRDHSLPYHSHRRGVKQDRFLILLDVISSKKEEMYLRFLIPRFSVILPVELLPLVQCQLRLLVRPRLMRWPAPSGNSHR